MSGLAVRNGRIWLGTHPAPRPCQDDGREEQIEPPLELVSTVVHRHQVYAPYFFVRKVHFSDLLYHLTWKEASFTQP